jgi:hypothetical protein
VRRKPNFNLSFLEREYLRGKASKYEVREENQIKITKIFPHFLRGHKEMGERNSQKE